MESIIADFVAQLVPDTTSHAEPIRGRVVMNHSQLVLVTTQDEKTIIPLDSIFDIAVGQASDDLAASCTHMVIIGFTWGFEQRAAIIGADSDTIDRFASVLFKAELSGSTATVKHPARIDGQELNTTPRTAATGLRNRAITFTETDDPFTIELPSVTRFEPTERVVEGRTQPVLLVRHVVDGRPMTSEISLESRRKMNILGRYLRLEYRNLMAELSGLDITEEEMRVLVALHHGDGNTDSTRLLETDTRTRRVAGLLDSLRKKGLVAGSDETAELTIQGRMVVYERIDDFDA